MKVEKATDKDFSRFYGVRVKTSWEGFVVKDGDLIVGIGGVLVLGDGTLWGFMDLGKKTRSPLLYRYVITYLKDLKERGIDKVHVNCSEHIPRAAAFLERLGFVRGDSDQWFVDLEAAQ